MSGQGQNQDWRSDRSLASDFTGSNSQDWASYTATATQFQTGSTTDSITTTATATASYTTITTTDSNGNSVTSTVALGITATTPGSDPEADSASSSGMSAGIKAAIGVGAVVGVIAIVALIFLLMRRRKRAAATDEVESVAEKPRKKWMSHFRNFTFDNEMLLSERGSVRTGRSVVGSVRSAASNLNGDTSYHNVSSEVDHPSPNYAHMNQVPPVLVISDVDGHGTLDRSLSVRTDATPPPPYQAATGEAPDSPISPASTHRNPFSDSRSNSPVQERANVNENPFSDDYRSHP